MDNPTHNEANEHEAEESFPIFKTAAYLAIPFMAIGLLVFLFKGPGLLLLLYILGGDFCC
ncbi:MAG TPA: hypothetical protein VGH19_18045 [Verrucomicrobiae bacterium]